MRTRSTQRRGRGRLLVAAVSMGMCTTALVSTPGALASTAQSGHHGQGAATPWPGGRWQPEPASFGMVVERDIPIKMDDGAVLYANVGYPADATTGERAAGKFPVLLAQNPYTYATEPDEFFVSRGYISAVVDVRGTQRSMAADGGPLAWQFFGPRHAKDGVELVTWAHGLDGSDGIVGLTGCSFLGIGQIFTAAAVGPRSPLKAILPACASHGYYVYFAGGIASAIATLFGGGVGAIIGTRNAAANEAFGTSLSHDITAGTGKALNNAFWQKRTTANVAARIVRNGIPALLWSGWDATESPGPLEEYAILQNTWAGRRPFAPMTPNQPTIGRYQVIFGPWAHGQGLDKTLQLEWFDTWLKGAHTDIQKTRTPLHLFEEQSARWVNASSYPIVDEYTPLHLGPNGSLTLHAASARGSDTLTWGPPAEPGTTLTYTTKPLEHGATIAGPIAASITATSNNRNVVLITKLNDIGPDGTPTQISFGALLGSRHTLDKTRSWYDTRGTAVNPVHPHQRDEYVPAGRSQRYEIKLLPKVWSVAPGHSLQLVLSTQPGPDDCQVSLARLPQAHPCHLSDAQLQTVPGGVYTIQYGSSTLNLPLLAAGALPTAASRVTDTSAGQSEPVDWTSRPVNVHKARLDASP